MNPRKYRPAIVSSDVLHTLQMPDTAYNNISRFVVIRKQQNEAYKYTLPDPLREIIDSGGSLTKLSAKQQIQLFNDRRTNVFYLTNSEGMYSITVADLARIHANILLTQTIAALDHPFVDCPYDSYYIGNRSACLTCQSVSVTDGTAGMGGNAIALAYRFPGGAHLVEKSRENYHVLKHNIHVSNMVDIKTNESCTRDLLSDFNPFSVLSDQNDSNYSDNTRSSASATDSSTSGNDSDDERSRTSLRFLRNIEMVQRPRAKNIHSIVCDSIVRMIDEGEVQTDALMIDPPWGGPGYSKQESINLTLDDILLQNIVNNAAVKCPKCITIGLKLPHNFNMIGFLSTCSTYWRVGHKYMHNHVNFIVLTRK